MGQEPGPAGPALPEPQEPDRPVPEAGGASANPVVIFAIPCLNGAPTFEHEASVLQLLPLLLEAKITYGFMFQPGDPYLAKVRNSLATRFLTEYPDATHLFFLDDDVGFDPQVAVKLIQSPFPVTAAIYPKRSDNTEYPVHIELDPKTELPIEKDGWYRSKRVPTGFLCIARGVLEHLCRGKGVYRDLDGKLRYNIFQMGFHLEPDAPIDLDTGEKIGDWWGEDYAFARQWGDAGGEIWVWPDANFTHTGRKQWQGNLMPSIAQYLMQNRKKDAAADNQKDAAE